MMYNYALRHWKTEARELTNWLTNEEEGPKKKKLRKLGHMSKLGLPYVPSTLVWTQISLEKYTTVYPTYLSKKFCK